MNLLECDCSEAQELYSRLPIEAVCKFRFKTRPLADNEVLKQFRGISERALQIYDSECRRNLTRTYNGESDTDSQTRVNPSDRSKETPLETDNPSPANPSNKPEEPLLEFAEGALLSKEQRKSARKSAKAKDQEIEDEAFIIQTLDRLANYLERKKDPTAGPGCPESKRRTRRMPRLVKEW